MPVTIIGFLNDYKLSDEVEFNTGSEAEAHKLFSDFCKEQKLSSPKIVYINVWETDDKE